MRGLSDLLTPDPGQERYSLSSELGTALQGVARGINTLDRRLGKDLLGKRTLGNASFDQLVRAANKDTLRVNQAGKITVPATRSAARTLEALREKKARIGGPLPGLDPHQARVARTVLRVGDRMGALPKEKLAAIEAGLVESSLRNLGYGDADSQGWRQERTSIYGTGPTGPRNVKTSAQRFFEESVGDTGGTRGAGMTAGELAQTIQASAFPERYDERAAEATAILRAYEQGGKPGPRLASELRQATARAKQLGIPTRPAPFNGDIQPDKSGTVLVRADAKGMVQWANSTLGTQEGTAKQIRWANAAGVASSAPWCSVWIAAGLARRGIKPPPNPAYSGSWLGWSRGERIDSLGKAKPGDLLVFDWGDGGITDHVALYAGNGQMIGGNQSDEVNQQAVPTGNIVGIVRPMYEGGSVRVSNATPLPGGAPGGVGAPGTGAISGTALSASQAQGRPETASVSVTPLAAPTAASAPLPAAFQEFQLGAVGEEESSSDLNIIDGILRRKRL